MRLRQFKTVRLLMLFCVTTLITVSCSDSSHITEAWQPPRSDFSDGFSIIHEDFVTHFYFLLKQNSGIHSTIIPPNSPFSHKLREILGTSAQSPSTREPHWKILSSKRTALQHVQLFVQNLPVQGSDLVFGNDWYLGAANEEWIDAVENERLQIANGDYHSPAEIAMQLSLSVNFDPTLFHFIETVLLVRAQKLIPAFRFSVESRDSVDRRGPTLPLELIADAATGEVITQQILALNHTGRALLYTENSVASSAHGLTEQLLPDLKNAEWLSGKRARTLNCSQRSFSYANCRHLSKGTNGIFFAPFESQLYDEINAYYAVTKAMTWYTGIMDNDQIELYGNFGLKYPLDIFVRGTLRDDHNQIAYDTAMYLPKGTRALDAPAIEVGSGWEPSMGSQGNRKKFLGKDSDVFFHEFSHHTIFRSLSDLSNVQTVGLHEGLADYFTYAITGNNRLAESILDGVHPLREANLEGTIDRYATSDTSPHKIGQYLSTVLWKLRHELATIASYHDSYFLLDKILFDAIDWLPPQAGLYELTGALIASTEQLANKRGFDSQIVKEKIFAGFQAAGFFVPNMTLLDNQLPPASEEIKRSAPKISHQKIARRIYPSPLPTMTGQVTSEVEYGGQLRAAPIATQNCGEIANAKNATLFGIHLALISPLLAAAIRSIQKSLKRFKSCANH